MTDLSGPWLLSDETGEYSLPIQLPGDTFTALLEKDLIPDPYLGRNELDVQWVGRRDWIVEREFDVPADAGEVRRVLVIDSIDCIAEIEINGEAIGRSTNMFVPFRADIGSALHKGTNRIRIILRSAERVARERAERLPYPVPHQVYPVQSMHRNLVRKVQCHSGWDWGPAMMVSGLYGRIAIEEEPRWGIVSAWCVPRLHGEGEWLVPVNIEIDSVADGGVPSEEITAGVTVRLLSPQGREVVTTRGARLVSAGSEVRPDTGTAQRAIVRLLVDLNVEDPLLWWPAGYGDQPLYTVQVEVMGRRRSVGTAFRTIQVINRADDHGRSLFFRVNGRDVWAKGANWIPVDAFPARQTGERYRALLQDAVDANMNMLRVWGGGQYEQDLFYRICDELGIMVWHDFMFSCSLYPSEEWFLQEVRDEVVAQVKRLTSHPSIAIWCGNNENVGALGWYPESRENPGRYLIDYDRLNSGVIGREVRRLDDTRLFWPSSPAAGEGDFSDNWHDDSSGDMHYWSVWHEGKPFEAYQDVTPRFCSEFGFQAFPSIHGIAAFTDPDQYNPTAPDLEHHQRHPRGNTVVTETMTRYFRFPFDFGNFLYLSQVQQALAIRTAVDFWRSRRPVSMGALYWQLNDLWPVVSWSGIEYDGRWKLLHYEARRFFAPLRLVCQVHNGMVETWMLNDTAGVVSGPVTLEFRDWSGKVLRERVFPVTAPSDAATIVDRTLLEELTFDRTEVFVHARWAEEETGDPPVECGWTFLTEPKRCELKEPRIEFGSVTDGSDRAYLVKCHDAPAFFTALESNDPAARFSDNGFLMLPGEERLVRTTVTTGDPDIRIRHLKATY